MPEFQQPNYTENFVQCVIDGGLDGTKLGSILVVGGDGRFLCTETVNLIIKIASANGVSCDFRTYHKQSRLFLRFQN